jgi:hypothetical protein
MAQTTVFIVQAFSAGRGNRLKADSPIPCKSPDAARRKAELLAPTKLGVVAYSTASDSELGEYDETPTVIFRTGRLPEQFDGDS